MFKNTSLQITPYKVETKIRHLITVFQRQKNVAPVFVVIKNFHFYFGILWTSNAFFCIKIILSVTADDVIVTCKFVLLFDRVVIYRQRSFSKVFLVIIKNALNGVHKQRKYSWTKKPPAFLGGLGSSAKNLIYIFVNLPLIYNILNLKVQYLFK